MNKHLLLLINCFLISLNLNSQTAKQAAVELWANVQTSPPTVTLNWVNIEGTT